MEAEPERSRTPVSGAQLRAEGRSSSPLTFLCWEKLHAIRSDVLEEFHKGIGGRRGGVGLHLSEGDPSEIVPSCHLPVCLEDDMAVSGRHLFGEEEANLAQPPHRFSQASPE